MGKVGSVMTPATVAGSMPRYNLMSFGWTLETWHIPGLDMVFCCNQATMISSFLHFLALNRSVSLRILQ